MREVRINLDDAMPLIREKLSLGEEVLFSPNGTSMLPTLRAGVDTVVLALPRGRLRKYDIALYRRKNGQYVLHRVIKSKEKYTFTGDNQFYNEKNIEESQIIALCVAYIRDGKRVSLVSSGARMKARIRLLLHPMRRLALGVVSRLRRILRKKK